MCAIININNEILIMESMLRNNCVKIYEVNKLDFECSFRPLLCSLMDFSFRMTDKLTGINSLPQLTPMRFATEKLSHENRRSANEISWLCPI